MSQDSNGSPAQLSLTIREHDAEKYTWISGFFAPPAGGFSDLPYFEVMQSRLSGQLILASRRQQLRLDFRPGDCTTATGLRNCTEVCSDPSALLTPRNLPACVLLASAALLVQNKTYTIDPSDTTTLRTIDAWSVPDLTRYNATGVLANVTKCVSQSCVGSALGECEDNVLALQGVRIIANNLVEISARLGRYCRGSNPLINPDIAGPGVSSSCDERVETRSRFGMDSANIVFGQVVLSYFFQASLALFFFVVTKLLSTWTRRLVTLFRSCRDDPAPRSQGAQLQSWLASSKPGAAIISSLVEFQEVQIYFVAVMQIAALVSFNPANPRASSSNQSSYAGALLNSIAVREIGIYSVFGILLVQCCLQRANMHWWYTFITMSVPYVLALTIFARNPNLLPSTDEMWTSFKVASPLPQCGSNPSPMTYCRLPYTTDLSAGGITGGIGVAAVGTLAWWTLLIDQLSFSIREKLPHVARNLGNLDRRGIISKILKSRAWSWILSLHWGIVQGLLLFWTYGYVSALVLVSSKTKIDDTANWTFGQFIAVTVWAPTIIKFIYFNTCKSLHFLPHMLSSDPPQPHPHKPPC